MKNTLNIQTDTLADRSILMGILYSVGAIFHLNSEPGVYTLEKAKDAYTGTLTLSVDKTDKGLDISGWNTTPDANFSTDPAKALELIKSFAAVAPTSILVKEVGDYEALVQKDGIHIYGQVIPFDKFDEIAAAVAKLNK